MAAGVVLAQNGEDHALTLEAQKLVLHGFKGIAREIIATLQAGNAVFAKNTAPHGVIKINRPAPWPGHVFQLAMPARTNWPSAREASAL